MAVTSLDVALLAGNRSGFFAGSSFFLVALGALLVHHVLWFQLARLFQLLDGPLFLWEGIVADLAIHQLVLMLVMRKRDFAPFATFQLHGGGSFVFHSQSHSTQQDR
jgi:hypothetical protein